MFGEKTIGILLLVGVFLVGGGLAWLVRGRGQKNVADK